MKNDSLKVFVLGLGSRALKINQKKKKQQQLHGLAFNYFN